MSFIIMSIEKKDGKEIPHFHRITAPNIEEAIRRGKALLKGAYVVAVINAKYEQALG